MKTEKIRRSVDSLQKIYAVIFALAISQVISATFEVNNGVLVFDKFVNCLPSLISFFAFVVPFYHGMNRHLDLCYIENASNQGQLLFDFIIFCIEAALLFIFTKYLPFGLHGFIVLGMLLFIDMVWGLISHWLHYKDRQVSIVRWALINLVTLFIGIVVFSIPCLSNKPFILMFLLVLRSIADYYFCWDFYFPEE